MLVVVARAKYSGVRSKLNGVFQVVSKRIYRKTKIKLKKKLTALNKHFVPVYGRRFYNMSQTSQKLITSDEKH